MLAGLIFATSDAADRPEALTATLAFGGATLVEYQARLLADAGAAQILIAVARVTPELLGAASRIGRRGVTVDVVRSAAEAAAKVHPLARVIVLADGLVTTETQLAPFAGDGEGGGDELLLATDLDNGLERLDARSRWAGIARIGAQRLAETASLPRDYDFPSALLRVAAQHGAVRLMLGAGAHGHGVEQDAAGLARRGRAVYAALAGDRTRWIDRWLLAPLARIALPGLVGQGASPLLLSGIGVGTGVGGLFALWQGWPVAGLAGASVATALFTIAGLLAWLRGEAAGERLAERGTAALAASAVILAGVEHDWSSGTATGSLLALALVIAATLVERAAALAPAQRWWPSVAGYPLLLLPFAALDQTLAGLAALGLYAAGTLASAIERARAEP